MHIAETSYGCNCKLTIYLMMTLKDSLKMQRREDFDRFLKLLMCIAVFHLSTTVCTVHEFQESEYFLSFIKSVDPKDNLGTRWNELSSNPCLDKNKGVKCNLQGTSITEIRLESLNLSGVIDVDALCKLQNLEVLSLARNLLHGTIPSLISHCRKLSYLNLSSNCLSGRVPSTLAKLKHLKSLDISNNQFSSIRPLLQQEFKQVYKYSKEQVVLQSDGFVNTTAQNEQAAASASKSSDNSNKELVTLMPFVIGSAIFFMYLYYMSKRADKRKKEKNNLKAISESPLKLPTVNPTEEVKPEDRNQELVFFVEEHESFKLDDLLDASADLRNQSLCTSLYKVILKNNTTYAVKRLKKLQVSVNEFSQIMRHIGNLKHRNILPLVGCSCNNEEKLLFYKYQNNGSLLSLLQEYIEGKKDFPWRIRLNIASNIAKGLAFMYQSSNDQEIIPHGNLKLSNILLGENMEPLISEYGISRLLGLKNGRLFCPNSYTAPEKTLSEKGDVYSYGVILLELLTGKTAEKTGVDLPKWVKSMVREEWTGEVFDKEVSKSALQWAFPLLNIALKCVSHSPQDRPTASEVMDKIDEALFAHDDRSISSIASTDSGHPDCCILHSVIPETWDTPGSNY